MVSVPAPAHHHDHARGHSHGDAHSHAGGASHGRAHAHTHDHTHVHDAASPHPAQAAPWSILRMTVAARLAAALAVCAVLWGMVFLAMR